MSEELEEMIEKYTRTYKDKSIKFEKMTILLPSFVNDVMSNGIDEVNQVRMSAGIFTSLIVDDYFDYIQALYNIDPSKYEEERLDYVRKQLKITIIPETNEKIDEIKKLVGTSDRVGVIKNAIEHYVRTNNINRLAEPVSESVD